MWSSFAYRHALFIAGISDPCYRRLLCLHDSIYDNQVVLTVAGRLPARQSHLPPPPSSRRPSPPPPPPSNAFINGRFSEGGNASAIYRHPRRPRKRGGGGGEREREKVKERKKEKENERKGEAETEGEAAIPGMAHKAPNGLFITPTTSTTGVRDR